MPKPSEQPTQKVHSLIVSNQQGKKAELTLPKLETWFASVEKSTGIAPSSLITQKEKDAYFATQFVGRFGLKDPYDVITFLKSPAGESVLCLIEEELEIIAAQKEERQFEIREEEARNRRIYAFLLMGLLYDKKAEAKELYHRIQEQIDKTLNDLDNPLKDDKNPTEAAYDHQRLLENELAAYDAASSAVGEKLQTKLSESEKLEAEMAAWEKENALITSKYKTYDNHLDSLQQELTKYGDLSDQKLLNKIDLQGIENNIKQLTQQLDKDAKEIGLLLESGNENDEGKANELIQKSNARNLQVATLKDMLSVVKGEHYLAKSDGSKATSFTDAEYIVPKDKKIIKDGDHYYLLKTNQNINELTHEDKKQAAKDYKSVKHDLINVKNLVSHNKKLEKVEHTKTKTSLTERSERMQQDINLLANQLTAIQSIRANITQMAGEDRQNQEVAPRLTPVPTTPKPAPGHAQQNIQANTYRHMLLLMKLGPSIEAIDRLGQNFSSHTDMQDTLKTLNTLRPGAPIPFQVMQNLLRNIERFGVDATKPNVAGNLNPKDKENAAATAPTPFDMRPKWGG